jgi:hypothetical protein
LTLSLRIEHRLAKRKSCPHAAGIGPRLEATGRDGDQPSSAGGDSGALIVDPEGRACALLFAGGEVGGHSGTGLTFAKDFAAVVRRRKIGLLDTW